MNPLLRYSLSDEDGRVYDRIATERKDGLSKRDLAESPSLAGLNIERAVKSLAKAGHIAAVAGTRRYAVTDGAS